jgi:hypothetical protein
VSPAAQAPSERRSRDQPWQRELADAIRDPVELCELLGLDPSLGREAAAAMGVFPLLVPRGFAARMNRGDPRDPLLMQVLPEARERNVVAGYSADPLEESAAVAAPGLVRKYAGRALLLATGGCAINCRYCFRREFPYAESGATRAGIESAIDALAADASLRLAASQRILASCNVLFNDAAVVRGFESVHELVASLVGWLVVWLVAWWVGWVACWFVGWLVSWLVAWLLSWSLALDLWVAVTGRG